MSKKSGETEAEAEDPTDTPAAKEASRIEEPAKVARVSAMLRRALDETREPLPDKATAARLVGLYQAAVDELSKALSSDLADELLRLSPAVTDSPATGGQARLAIAQVLGWLDGLMQGIQGALMAQQAAALASGNGKPTPTSATGGLILVPTGQPTPGNPQLSESGEDGGRRPGQYL